MSTWTDVRDSIVKLGLPLIGAALPLPGGAAIGSALAKAIGSPGDKPEDILLHLTKDADAIQKAREFEANHEQIILKITVEAEQKAQEGVTERWKADMASDSWLAKNIRPMVLIAILTLYAIFAFASGAGFNINESYVSLLGQWGMLIMSAYFVGRSVEKIKIK